MGFPSLRGNSPLDGPTGDAGALRRDGGPERRIGARDEAQSAEQSRRERHIGT